VASSCIAILYRPAAGRRGNRGHVSLGQLKAMSAIEGCRTAALGGHVARWENEACRHSVIACNSCRNRHFPKCQGSQAREWLEARKAELLEVPYFHVVPFDRGRCPRPPRLDATRLGTVYVGASLPGTSEVSRSSGLADIDNVTTLALGGARLYRKSRDSISSGSGRIHLGGERKISRPRL
jgi:hypothetical protein